MYIMEQRRNYLFFAVNVCTALMMSVIINLSIKVLPISFTDAGALVANWKVLSFSFIFKVLLIAADLLIIFQLIKRFVERRSHREKSQGIMQSEDSVRKQVDKTNGNKVFLRSFLLCIVFWFILFLVLFPGAGMNDTVNGLMSPYLEGNMQPFLYQTYVHYIFKFGQLLFHGNGTLAYALLTVIQILFCAFCVSYSAVWLFRRSLLSEKASLIYTLYFCLMPIIADYVITIVKDVPFSFALLVFIPALYDTIEDCRSEAYDRTLQELPEKMKGRPVICKKWVLLGVSSFIIWFSRNNGKYIIIATILLTLLMVRKNVKKYLIVLLIMLVIDKGSSFVLTSLNPYDCALRESSGILLNQISAVVAAEGNVSSEDREFIDQILPYDRWGELYTPSFIDPLKFSEEFDNDFLNDHKSEFLKTWFHLVDNNLEVCVKSYVIHTYGLWSVMINAPRSYSQSFFTNIHSNVEGFSRWGLWLNEQKALNIDILPASLNRKLQSFFISCFSENIRIPAGVMLCILLLLVNISLNFKSCIRKPLLIVLLVDLLIWGTQMIAAPTSLMFRYSFYMLLTLPVLMILVISAMKSPAGEMERT